jgi:hypothetical protein
MKSKKRNRNKKRTVSKKKTLRRTHRRGHRRQVKRRTVGRSRVHPIDSIALTPREAAVQRRIFRALRRMREGESLSRATREERLKPKTFLRYARPALRRGGPGKPWKAIPEDKLKSVMNIHTGFGPTPEIIGNSHERKILGRYNRALRMFRAGEDGAEAALLKFRGKKIAGHILITDIKELIRLEEAGRLDFDDLYTSLGEES